MFAFLRLVGLRTRVRRNSIAQSLASIAMMFVGVSARITIDLSCVIRSHACVGVANRNIDVRCRYNHARGASLGARAVCSVGGGKYDCSRASFVGGLLMCVSGAH